VSLSVGVRNGKNSMPNACLTRNPTPSLHQLISQMHSAIGWVNARCSWFFTGLQGTENFFMNHDSRSSLFYSSIIEGRYKALERVSVSPNEGY